jgi:hypothetical protein
MENMRIFKNSTIVMITLMLSSLTFTACDLLNNETYSQDDLIGTWEIDGATATIKAAGIDILSVMKAPPFNMLSEEADSIFNALAEDVLAKFSGSMGFMEDSTYTLSLSDVPTENGTWEFNEENGVLELSVPGTGLTSTTLYEVKSLDSEQMTVETSGGEVELDLNKDETPETTAKIVIIIDLSKLQPLSQ